MLSLLLVILIICCVCILYTFFFFPCRHLSSELSEHEKLIDKMVSADFTKYITEDLNRPLDDIRPLLEEVGGLQDWVGEL